MDNATKKNAERLFSWWNEKGQRLVADGLTIRAAAQAFRQGNGDATLDESTIMQLIAGYTGKSAGEYL